MSKHATTLQEQRAYFLEYVVGIRQGTEYQRRQLLQRGFEDGSREVTEQLDSLLRRAHEMGIDGIPDRPATILSIRTHAIEVAKLYDAVRASVAVDESLWRNTRWIVANSEVTSDDIRAARKRGKSIQQKPVDNSHPLYFVPDVEREFPSKACGIVKKIQPM
jgi:hypothetical protein